MAYVITNGTVFVKYNENGKTLKTENIEEAFQFASISSAIKGMKKAKKKTKNFYVYDTFTNHIIWKWLSQQEIKEHHKETIERVEVKRNAHGKIIRKKYSNDVRRLLYMQASGRCQLCGRKLLFEDMTIDHIFPLSMGGVDSVENLQVCCAQDNQFKGSVLPSDFFERITEIFMFQMEKKHKHNIFWKIAKRIMKNMMAKDAAGGEQ